MFIFEFSGYCVLFGLVAGQLRASSAVVVVVVVVVVVFGHFELNIAVADNQAELVHSSVAGTFDRVNASLDLHIVAGHRWVVAVDAASDESQFRLRNICEI